MHRIQLDVLVGQRNFRKATDGQNAVQLNAGPPRRQLGDAYLAWEDGAPLDPPLVDKVPVSAMSDGAGRGTVTVRLECVPLGETVEAWKNAVYDVIQAAWQAWKRRYDEAVAAREVRGSADRQLAPARTAEIVREELKRQVIEMLIGERFTGDDLVSGSPPQTNLGGVQGAAGRVQFLEQAFEWKNLTFALYPYYWAWQGSWDELAGIDGADPQFTAFLRSGAARVVVPARPGFEASVNHFMTFGEPWEGGIRPGAGRRAVRVGGPGDPGPYRRTGRRRAGGELGGPAAHHAGVAGHLRPAAGQPGPAPGQAPFRPGGIRTAPPDRDLTHRWAIWPPTSWWARRWSRC